nr:DUF2080 family transposase-associated protein [Candidatus Woesearchaeota archaeon]
MRKVSINTKNKISIENIEGFVKRQVTKFGNSAKVSCPKEFLGKEAYLVIVKNESD